MGLGAPVVLCGTAARIRTARRRGCCCCFVHHAYCLAENSVDGRAREGVWATVFLSCFGGLLREQVDALCLCESCIDRINRDMVYYSLLSQRGRRHYILGSRIETTRIPNDGIEIFNPSHSMPPTSSLFSISCSTASSPA